MNLEILYGGELYWNGDHVDSIEQLTPKLLAAASGNTLVKVSAEKRAPYERVAQVLAAAQRSHVQKLTILPVADL